MSFDPATLFLSLITSGIGCVRCMYGKKQDRMPQLIGGIALMIYPYFVADLLLNVLAGVGIIGAVWLAVRQGW